jgi:cytosine/uracil/thiamine/allantoin permease
MDTNKRIARMVGVLYIIGTVSDILSVVFSASLLNASDYLAKIAESDTQMITAALCVLTMGLLLALIPIIALPVLRKQSETLALG